MRKLAPVLLLLFCLVAFAGCGKSSLEFDEEVSFKDGETIAVHRLVNIERRGELGGGWVNVETSSQLTLKVDGKKIEWESELLPVLIEKKRSLPLPIIVAVPLTCDDFNRFGRPNPSYIEFQYADGKWNPYPVSNEMLGQKTNLLVDMDVAAKKKHVDLKEKEAHLSSGKLTPSYLRKIEATHRSMCGQ